MATKLTANAHTVELLVRRSADPRTAARRIADGHRARNRVIDEHNRAIFGVVPPETDFVDGKRNVPFEQVRLNGGTILTRYETLAEVLQWIEFQLISNSPYLTGRYAQSHKLYADLAETDPSNPAPAGTYVFMSTVPYARKIEGIRKGGEKRPGQSTQAPDGVYEGVAALARARWGRFADIRFTFDSIVGLKQGDRYPAIRIRYK